MMHSRSPLGIFMRGFLMGCADIVPGISGGTVAFITGIYDRLVAAIKGAVSIAILLIRGKGLQVCKQLDLALLIPLFLGIACAFLTMAKFISYCMSEHPERTWSLFLGLMLGSTWLIARMEKNWKLNHISIAVLCAILAFRLTNLNLGPQATGEMPSLIISEGNIQGQVLAEPIRSFWLSDTPMSYFFSGAVAIVAMILPGISGSFLLLVMGKYDAAIGALNALRELRVMEFLNVALPMGAGCILGLAAFSWILDYMLKKHHSLTVAMLLGLMIGSMQKLWPFRYELSKHFDPITGKTKVLADTAYLPSWHHPLVPSSLALACLGLLLVLSLEWFRARQLPDDGGAK